MTARESRLAPDEILERIGRTLREDIAPAVATDYPRTQAFMGAVVLRKLAGQLRRAEADAAADRREADELAHEIAPLLEDAPAPLRVALDALRAGKGPAEWSRLVEELYRARAELGAERFDAGLAQVRARLRARLDRQLTYSA